MKLEQQEKLNRREVDSVEEKESSFVSYSQRHNNIVESGSEAIKKYLFESVNDEKRSLLLCLDRYLDPYFGYNLSFFDEIILLLQEQLYQEQDKDIIEDVFQLITDYSKGQLDYLAERIDKLDPHYLADALYAIGITYNKKYLPLLFSYENHGDPNVRRVAQDALKELSRI
ncbi:hypothetical protein [Paenibacillus sp. NAIST15-1]|uniref:hypothetical protein n=1 Tax=Paenibacillus sp. NAIST15-1 TaxID=1605994 RepID=UPI0009341AA5|nr:hypothetical protein [Paenibacillus sp. NAIST15-1]